MKPQQEVLVFTDLDGCLLNKADYSWDDASPTLDRLRQFDIPVILSSSKTVAEMLPLQAEMGLHDTPLISENGGTICWSTALAGGGETVTEAGRRSDDILTVLGALKPEFCFRTFRDLGISGIMEATGLPRMQAEAAARRHSTVPLLWQDAEDRIAAFRAQVESQGLTLTRGGRFWHVAGQTSKGEAMETVLSRYSAAAPDSSWITLAIGDSPIDQSMLDRADHPIGIPAPDGSLHVRVPARHGRVASVPGAAGWSEAVSAILNQLGV